MGKVENALIATLYYIFMQQSLINSEEIHIIPSFSSSEPKVGESFCFFLNATGLDDMEFEIELHNCKATFTPQLIYRYFSNNTFQYNEDNKITHRRIEGALTNQSQEFCVSRLQRRDFQKQYIWKVTNVTDENFTTTEKKITIPISSYFPPRIYSIAMFPPVVNIYQRVCMNLKYSHHPYAPFHVIKIQSSLAVGHYRNWTDVFEVKRNVPFVNRLSYIYYRISVVNSVYDRMCLNSLNKEDYDREFKWIIEDFHQQRLEKTFSFANPVDYNKNIIFEAATMEPLISMTKQKSCITINYTNTERISDPETETSFYVAFPDSMRDFYLLYTYYFLTGHIKFASTNSDKSISMVIERIDKLKSTFNKICFSKMASQDHVSKFRWSIKTLSNKVKQVDLFFQVVAQTFEVPKISNLIPKDFYDINDTIDYSCEIEDVSPDASLIWYINGNPAPLHMVFDQHVDFPTEQIYTTVTLKSNLQFPITNQTIEDGQNIVVQCKSIIAEPSINLTGSYEDIITIKGVKKSNSIIYGVKFYPVTPIFDQYFCIYVEYEIDADYYLLYLEMEIVPNDGVLNNLTHKIYRYHSKFNSFPNGVSTSLGEINMDNTIENQLCFVNAKSFKDTQFRWTITDTSGNIVKKTFNLNISEPTGTKIPDSNDATVGIVLGVLISIIFIAVIIVILIKKTHICGKRQVNQGTFQVMDETPSSNL